MPKINEYTEKTSPDDVDIFLLQDASATKKITFLSIFNQIKTKLGLGGLATKSKISQEDLETALANLIAGKLTASGIANDYTTTDLTKVLAAVKGKELKEYIGTLTALTTTEKTNLVGAINEIFASVDALNRNLTNRLNWTLVETNIPATTITQFPSDKKEILVGIIYGSNNNTYVLSKVFYSSYDFSSGSYTFHLIGGKQSGTNSAGGYIAIRTGSVYIDSVFHNEANIKSLSKYFVAYR